MYLSIDGECRKAFLVAASRLAEQPIHLKAEGRWLEIEEMSSSQIAAALVASALPCWERQQLEQLAQQHLSFLSSGERQRSVSLAAAILLEDGSRSGADEVFFRLLPYLEQGQLDFDGFCRFNRPLLEGKLRYLLEIAADQVLAAAEEDDYLQLLRRYTAAVRRYAPQRSCELLCLRCLPQQHCQLWLLQEQQLRLAEGGCFNNKELMLLSNILALAPRRLLIYGREQLSRYVCTTLEAVFGSRLSYIAAWEESFQISDSSRENSLTSASVNGTINK